MHASTEIDMTHMSKAKRFIKEVWERRASEVCDRKVRGVKQLKRREMPNTIIERLTRLSLLYEKVFLITPLFHT